MQSVWHKNVQKPMFETLNGDVTTDVLVVGGGMAGILCGYRLKQAGIDCVIAEADRIGDGITQNTTAKITCHHGAVFDTMLKRFGTEKTALYVKANQQALQQYETLCATVDCDFETHDSVVYSLDDRRKIEAEVTALRTMGCPAMFCDSLDLPFTIAGAVRVPRQAQFHPLKFLYALARDLRIFEHTRVTQLTPDGAVTPHGTIKARHVIVATHFPFINQYGGYFLKMHQHRSYVVALENAPSVRGMYVDEAENGLSFRNFGNRLLLGGGGHRTGKQGENWQVLRQFAQYHYPQAQEVAHWATQDCKTLDDIPYIGPYSKRLPHVYVATGFNKWGMTSSMVAATLLADGIQGKQNDYAAVFSPSRTVFRPQLAVNAAETVFNLLTPTTPRCPHLGCALKYNRQEHSWDCPCHGSRFTKDGQLIDNPATDNMKP